MDNTRNSTNATAAPTGAPVVDPPTEEQITPMLQPAKGVGAVPDNIISPAGARIFANMNEGKGPLQQEVQQQQQFPATRNGRQPKLMQENNKPDPYGRPRNPSRCDWFVGKYCCADRAPVEAASAQVGCCYCDRSYYPSFIERFAGCCCACCGLGLCVTGNWDGLWSASFKFNLGLFALIWCLHAFSFVFQALLVAAANQSIWTILPAALLPVYWVPVGVLEPFAALLSHLRFLNQELAYVSLLEHIRAGGTPEDWGGRHTHTIDAHDLGPVLRNTTTFAGITIDGTYYHSDRSNAEVLAYNPGLVKTSQILYLNLHTVHDCKVFLLIPVSIALAVYFISWNAKVFVAGIDYSYVASVLAAKRSGGGFATMNKKGSSTKGGTTGTTTSHGGEAAVPLLGQPVQAQDYSTDVHRGVVTLEGQEQAETTGVIVEGGPNYNNVVEEETAALLVPDENSSGPRRSNRTSKQASGTTSTAVRASRENHITTASSIKPRQSGHQLQEQVVQVDLQDQQKRRSSGRQGSRAGQKEKPSSTGELSSGFQDTSHITASVDVNRNHQQLLSGPGEVLATTTEQVQNYGHLFAQGPAAV
ncbi:unnamed protein product [Amoebophrya sp. A120]|nr:unnamed protein product [Amoebophrya sp. A120]|eukprot:GSA120T00022182001.1